MDRHVPLRPLQVAGPRDQLVEQLREMAVGWDRLCRPERASECLGAAEQLELEETDDVQVGHSIYTVQE